MTESAAFELRCLHGRIPSDPQTVIPGTVTGKFSLRIVPNQDPAGEASLRGSSSGCWGTTHCARTAHTMMLYSR